MKIKVLRTDYQFMLFSAPFRDTTVGTVYNARLLMPGDLDDDGDYADRECITFLDDVGDVIQAAIEHEYISYVVVA